MTVTMMVTLALTDQEEKRGPAFTAMLVYKETSTITNPAGFSFSPTHTCFHTRAHTVACMHAGNTKLECLPR